MQWLTIGVIHFHLELLILKTFIFTSSNAVPNYHYLLMCFSLIFVVSLWVLVWQQDSDSVTYCELSIMLNMLIVLYNYTCITASTECCTSLQSLSSMENIIPPKLLSWNCFVHSILSNLLLFALQSWQIMEIFAHFFWFQSNLQNFFFWGPFY